ncbi:transmembrane/coiled-coil protein [Actinidia rufa]|uniref:Transmembrane/coiled-coil protein n=1 Tax=Actinidia rufa TaxID=165716 RepID=A0A7J0FLX3_9ERIC|nr:transmembrane/coiled-coil protein [Actinidia rufa]
MSNSLGKGLGAVNNTTTVGLAFVKGDSKFLRLLSEESSDASSDTKDKELALSKAVDVMAQSTETTADF